MAQRVNSASFLNTLHYCCSSNAPKISNPQNYDIREMEKDKNEWVNDWESVLCIYTNTHYMSICMWSNLSSWTIKHQLQEGTTCYLYIRVVVKKTERGKVSYMELFVKSEEKLIYLCSLFQLHQAMKRHTYYLWLALKCSSRNKAKEKFSVWVCTIQKYGWKRADWTDMYLTPWSLSPLQSQSGSYHTQMWQISFLRCQKFRVWLLKWKYPWTIVPILKRHFTQFSHRKQGLKASLISWN